MPPGRKTYEAFGRVHVGCGPKHILPSWWNVDIRKFDGIDQQLDVTKSWPFENLDFVYSEHFISALFIDDAITWLRNVCQSLKPNGRLRISTPNLRWVYRTHFNLQEQDPARCVQDTMTLNRAFHGWGYRFLYTPQMLQYILEGVGFTCVAFYEYGKSGTPALINLEQHGGYSVVEGDPSVVIAEGARPEQLSPMSKEFLDNIEDSFAQYVKYGY